MINSLTIIYCTRLWVYHSLLQHSKKLLLVTCFLKFRNHACFAQCIFGILINSQRLYQTIACRHTVKALLSPGGLFIFSSHIGGLNREEGLLERGAYYKHEAKIYKTVLMHFHGKIYKTKTFLAAAWVCPHLVNYNILILHSHQPDQGC